MDKEAAHEFYGNVKPSVGTFMQQFVTTAINPNLLHLAYRHNNTMSNSNRRTLSGSASVHGYHGYSAVNNVRRRFIRTPGDGNSSGNYRSNRTGPSGHGRHTMRNEERNMGIYDTMNRGGMLNKSQNWDVPLVEYSDVSSEDWSDHEGGNNNLHKSSRHNMNYSNYRSSRHGGNNNNNTESLDRGDRKYKKKIESERGMTPNLMRHVILSTPKRSTNKLKRSSSNCNVNNAVNSNLTEKNMVVTLHGNHGVSRSNSSSSKHYHHHYKRGQRGGDKYATPISSPRYSSGTQIAASELEEFIIEQLSSESIDTDELEAELERQHKKAKKEKKSKRNKKSKKRKKKRHRSLYDKDSDNSLSDLDIKNVLESKRHFTPPLLTAGVDSGVPKRTLADKIGLITKIASAASSTDAIATTTPKDDATTIENEIIEEDGTTIKTTTTTIAIETKNLSTEAIDEAAATTTPTITTTPAKNIDNKNTDTVNNNKINLSSTDDISQMSSATPPLRITNDNEISTTPLKPSTSHNSKKNNLGMGLQVTVTNHATTVIESPSRSSSRHTNRHHHVESTPPPSQKRRYHEVSSSSARMRDSRENERYRREKNISSSDMHMRSRRYSQDVPITDVYKRGSHITHNRSSKYNSQSPDYSVTRKSLKRGHDHYSTSRPGSRSTQRNHEHHTLQPHSPNYASARHGRRSKARSTYRSHSRSHSQSASRHRSSRKDYDTYSSTEYDSRSRSRSRSKYSMSRSRSRSHSLSRSPEMSSKKRKRLEYSKKIGDTSLFAELVKDRYKREKAIKEIIDRQEENSSSSAVIVTENSSNIKTTTMDAKHNVGKNMQITTTIVIDDDNNIPNRITDIKLPNGVMKPNAISRTIAPTTTTILTTATTTTTTTSLSQSSGIITSTTLTPPPPPPPLPSTTNTNTNTQNNVTSNSNNIPAKCGTQNNNNNNLNNNNKFNGNDILKLSSKDEVDKCINKTTTTTKIQSATMKNVKLTSLPMPPVFPNAMNAPSPTPSPPSPSPDTPDEFENMHNDKLSIATKTSTKQKQMLTKTTTTAAAATANVKSITTPTSIASSSSSSATTPSSASTSSGGNKTTITSAKKPKTVSSILNMPMPPMVKVGDDISDELINSPEDFDAPNFSAAALSSGSLSANRSLAIKKFAANLFEHDIFDRGDASTSSAGSSTDNLRIKRPVILGRRNSRSNVRDWGERCVDVFEMIAQIGEGTYGQVC